jgi:ABC-type transport system involved in multi-copper enzyme maturation permease subunit
MKNVGTIMRRELAAYFTSPIGYIFMIVFVTISVGLFITSFFTFPVADMRPFFSNLPALFCVFVPAVTMRVWAEERKENTWEMLLTFPMKAWQLVMGKFFATLVFLALTLCTTATVPVMLLSLGKPDVGAMASAYAGTVFLGAFFLSIGIFFSGFFKDQILAFVVTLLTCFSLFLVGTNFIAAYLDGYVSGLGGLLSSLLGFSDHFGAFARGVIEISDIVYFVGWTALFLFLNVIYIDRRSRAGSRLLFAGATVLCLGIGFFANWFISDISLGRFDVTEDKIYTVSPASKRILSAVDTPVQVKLYITPRGDMPTGLTNLQQEISDKLDELSIISGGKLKYEVINLRVEEAIADVKAEEEAKKKAEEGADKPEALEKRLLDKGVEPFAVQAMSQDQMTSKLIYSSLGVAYKDKKEEILPQILPQSLQELEYRLVSTIYKLTRPKKPVVALVAPKEAVNIPPELRRLYEQIGQQIPQSEDPYELLQRVLDMERYEVQRVELTQASPLLAEYETLVVINPRGLNERQRWEIARALQSGKSVVMAVQTYEWNYQATPQGLSVTSREEKPEVNALLEAYGLKVSEDILMDVNQVPMTVNGGNPLTGMGQQVNLPIQILVNNSMMDPDTSITSRLSEVFYLWGTAIELNKEKLSQAGIEAKALMSSTRDAWVWPKGQQLTSAAFDPPTQRDGIMPMMVLAKGQFPDAFAGKERPAWPVAEQQPGQFPPPPPPDEDAPARAITPAPGKLVLIGCSEMFRKEFLQAGNLDLFMNSVDAVTLGDDLVNVRGRKPIDRIINRPRIGVQQTWKVINYGLATAIIAVTGVAVALARRRSRDAYTLAHSPARR